MKRTTLKELLALHEKAQLVGAFSVTNDDYHASPGLSKSSISDILVSPAYYKWRVQNPVNTTGDMIQGSVYHCLALEDEPFEDLFYPTKTQPIDSKLDDLGREPISQANLEKIKEALKVFKANPLASAMLSGHREIAFYWTDPTTGILCKCKPDIFIPEKGVCVDLKFTRNANREGFARDCVERGYHIQAAFYLDGIRLAMEQSGRPLEVNPDKFIFAPQEKTPPYDFAFYSIGPASIQAGEQDYKKGLAIYADCVQSDQWPGISKGKIQELELPSWFFAKKGQEYDNGEI